MKNLLLALFTFPLVCFGQVNIQHIDNECPNEDVLRVCVEDEPYAGIYKYETVFDYCNGEKMVSGEIEMIVNSRGHYYVPDFSFGAWEECYNITDGTRGTVEMRAICSFITGIVGTDSYGDVWSSDNFRFEGNSFTFNWFNTYGEFGETTLTPIDGRILNDPTQVIETNFDIQWSTGETGPSIQTIETGEFSVTVTDDNGISEVGSIIIEENEPSIIKKCSGEIIEFSYFLDDNENGVQDNNEPLLNNGETYVQLYPTEKMHGYVGEQFERFVVMPGTYILTFDNPKYEATNLPNEVLIVEDIGIKSLNIGLKIIQNIKSIDVNISATRIERCNWLVPYRIRIQNDGTIPYNDELQLTIDPAIEIVSSSVDPIQQVDNVITWAVDIEEPTGIEYIILYLRMPTADLLGEILCISAIAETLNKNYTAYCFELLCAHDPNDKHGTPFRGGENKTLFGESLEYTIRFENLGNDTAFNIKVTDYLEENYDLRTFKLLQTSHPTTRHWIDGDRILHVEFDNIQLPSVEQDTLLNKGFLQFTIDPLPGLSENTEISNTASIFFDLNDAIVTNTTTHTLVSSLTTSIVNKNYEIDFSIKPNPSSSIITFQYNSVENIHQVKVLNVQGQAVLSFSDKSNSTDISHLEAGVYFIELTLSNGKKGIQKFVKI